MGKGSYAVAGGKKEEKEGGDEKEEDEKNKWREVYVGFFSMCVRGFKPRTIALMVDLNTLSIKCFLVFERSSVCDKIVIICS